MTLSSQVKLYTTLHKIDVSQNWAYKHRSIQHGVTEHTQVLLVCQGFQLVKGPSLLELQVGYARQCPWNLCPYFYPPNMTVRSLLYLRKSGNQDTSWQSNMAGNPSFSSMIYKYSNYLCTYAEIYIYIYILHRCNCWWQLPFPSTIPVEGGGFQPTMLDDAST